MRISVQIGNPNTEYREPVSTQEPIAASVSCALFDSMLRRAVNLLRVGVPVVAVNLNHQGNVWQQEVTDQITDANLGNIFDTGGVKQPAHLTFWRADELPAVGVLPIHCSVMAWDGTEPDTLLDPALVGIETLATLGARYHLAGLAGKVLARVGAKALAGFSSRLKELAAHFAGARYQSLVYALAFTRAIFPRTFFDLGGRLLGIELSAADSALDRLAALARGDFGVFHPSPCAALNRAKALRIMPAPVPELFAASLAGL